MMKREITLYILGARASTALISDGVNHRASLDGAEGMS